MELSPMSSTQIERLISNQSRHMTTYRIQAVIQAAQNAAQSSGNAGRVSLPLAKQIYLTGYAEALLHINTALQGLKNKFMED